MPEKETLKRAREDKRKGRAPSTQAGEFVREEMHHIRRGKHGAKSPEQAIAIGLSKARRSGIALAPPEGPSETRERAKKDIAGGGRKKTSAKRARATSRALKREGRSAASEKALASHARRAARRRTAADRSASARKAARTKGPAARSAAARKAARTRARRTASSGLTPPATLRPAAVSVP